MIIILLIIICMNKNDDYYKLSLLLLKVGPGYSQSIVHHLIKCNVSCGQ